MDVEFVPQAPDGLPIKVSQYNMNHGFINRSLVSKFRIAIGRGSETPMHCYKEDEEWQVLDGRQWHEAYTRMKQNPSSIYEIPQDLIDTRAKKIAYSRKANNDRHQHQPIGMYMSIVRQFALEVEATDAGKDSGFENLNFQTVDIGEYNAPRAALYRAKRAVYDEGADEEDKAFLKQARKTLALIAPNLSFTSFVQMLPYSDFPSYLVQAVDAGIDMGYLGIKRLGVAHALEVVRWRRLNYNYIEAGKERQIGQRFMARAVKTLIEDDVRVGDVSKKLDFIRGGIQSDLTSDSVLSASEKVIKKFIDMSSGIDKLMTRVYNKKVDINILSTTEYDVVVSTIQYMSDKLLLAIKTITAEGWREGQPRDQLSAEETSSYLESLEEENR